MLPWALLLLVVAVIAVVFSFWKLVGTALWIAKVMFVVCLLLFVLALFFGYRPPAA